MKSIHFYLSIAICLFYLSCKTSKSSVAATNTNAVITRSSIDSRLTYLSNKMVKHLSSLPVDSMKIPRALEADGSMIATPSKQWTSGFFPGILWQLAAHSNDPTLIVSAKKWTSFVEKEKMDKKTHDLGFKLNGSFGKGYVVTKDPNYKEVIIQASKTLITRYNPKIGSIRSWDWNADIWQFPVIIDNMMNLEMLFDATAFTGDKTYANIADQHAKTTLANHFRPDNSSYHVVDYDTISGKPRLKTTHQGYSASSAWSRGQGWGLYGYTLCYERTQNPDYLKQAQKIADYIFSHPNMPTDLIPYWDFNAPNIPNEPRDVSAACVMASALITLSQLDKPNSTKYLALADKILLSLEQESYNTNVGPFLLNQSTGSVPGKFEVNVPIIYAEYYYIEALLKRKGLM